MYAIEKCGTKHLVYRDKEGAFWNPIGWRIFGFEPHRIEMIDAQNPMKN